MSSGRERMGRAFVRAQPWLLRNGDVLFRPLRRVRPVLRIKKAVVLTRHAEVREVLERDDVFSVTYGEHMEAVTGPFILGWDDGPDYRREVGALRAAVRREDLHALAELTRSRVRERVAAGGRLDVVELADEAVGAGLDRYFGVPEVASAEQREAARDVFRAVFLDAETPATLQRGRDSAAKVIAGVDAAMARIRATDAPDDTVLGRLLAAADLDDDALHRNLLGLVAAWAASVPRAFSLAFDVLLDRPPELARVAAARDPDTVATLVLEALRLQPQAPFLIRKARGEMVIAPGSEHEQRIRPGDVVVAVTQSAMRDRYVLDQPGALRTDRDRHEILHFGAGMHRCFGAAISTAQFGAIGTELLAAGDVRRAGPLAWGAAFPKALPVDVGR